MRPRMTADAAGRYRAGPAGDHRHSYAAFIEVAFDAAQRSRALEEPGVAASLLMRAVVADEHHQGVALDATRAQEIGEPADIAIHARDHRGERRMWFRLRTVTQRGKLRARARRPGVGFGVLKRLLGKSAAHGAHRVFGRTQLGVRNGVVQVDERTDERRRAG